MILQSKFEIGIVFGERFRKKLSVVDLATIIRFTNYELSRLVYWSIKLDLNLNLKEERDIESFTEVGISFQIWGPTKFIEC